MVYVDIVLILFKIQVYILFSWKIILGYNFDLYNIWISIYWVTLAN